MWGSRQAARALTCAATAALAAACAEDFAAGAAPAPTARLHYPTALAAASDGSAFYVVSTDFDQQFDGGWVAAVGTDAWLADMDLGAALQRGRVLRVPALGGRLALTADGAHALLPHRGNGLLTLVDIGRDGADVPTQLGCGTQRPGSLPAPLDRLDCDRAHLVDLTVLAAPPGGPSSFRRVQDPFVVAQTQVGGAPLLAVGYLGSNVLSALAVDFDAPRVSLARTLTVASGALASLMPHPDGAGKLLGSSRKAESTHDLSAVYEVDLTASLAAPAETEAAATCATSVAADVGGSELSALALAPDHTRLYALNRGPDAVVLLRRLPRPLSVGIGGGVVAVPAPSFTLVGATAVDRAAPSDIVYVPRAAGDLVVVSSLAQDALLFFAPQGDALQLVWRLPLAGAQGPAALLHLRRQGRDLLLVSSFFDHGLTAVDITGPSYAQFTQVAQYHETSVSIAARN